MNLRTPLILFGVLLILIAVFFGLQFFGYQTPVERKESEKYLLASLRRGKERFAVVPAADFTQVVITRTNDDGSAERIEFRRKPSEDGKGVGPWEMVAPKKVRVSTRAVDSLIEQLADAQKDLQADLGKDLSLYGLDKPSVTVTLTRDVKDKEGKKTGTEELTVSFGKTSPHKEDPLIYAMTSEAPNKPVAVPKNRVDRALGSVNDFRDKELLGSAINVQGVRVAKAGEKPMELARVHNRDWKFVEPKYGEADTRAADDLVNALSDIRVARNEDFVDDGPLDEAKLSKYGVTPEKATATATFRVKSPTDTAEKTSTLLIGQRDAEQENRLLARRGGLLAGDCVPVLSGPWSALAGVAAFQAGRAEDAQTVGYYARLQTDEFVVRIEAKHLKAFEKNPDELRSRHLARLDATKVDAIDLKSAGETLRFRRPQLTTKGESSASTPVPSEWDLHTDQRATVKTHLDTVTKLIDAVNKVEVSGPKNFLDDDAKQRAWFGSDPLDLGLDQPRAELTFWEEGIQRDKDGKPEGSGEPKLKADVKDKPALRLAIGRKDEKRGVIYVRREMPDTLPAILAVPDPWQSSPTQADSSARPFPPADGGRQIISLSELATAGYYHYRDHVLPSFKPNEAIKLTFTRSDVTYELEREPQAEGEASKPRPWKLKQPVEGDGATATDMLLLSLSRISADRLITDRATDRDRKEKFGLADNPLLQCQVTVKEKDKKEPAVFRYVIGRPAEGSSEKGKNYYARVEIKPSEGPTPDANDFVFLVPEDVVRMLDVELRANTVFSPESSAKPASVKLTWHDKTKNFEKTVLELAYKKGQEGNDKGTWEVVSYMVGGKDAKDSLPKLDFAKVNRLVGLETGMPQISLLSTERFILHKGQPKEEWRLNPEDAKALPSFMVEVKYDNGNSRTLIVGETYTPDPQRMPGLRGGSYYLARSSTLPDAVFLLNGADFKPLVEGIAFFRAAEPMASGPRKADLRGL
ncbi:MAG: DUF4340 domain-containing protein [Gemmatales bacterium]|nr:DUF4340 domain-containing protein [Gemmatales bacterium]MDW8386491.1 DUF4340 domain-containing protein [Gemmatales bacterium]